MAASHQLVSTRGIKPLLVLCRESRIVPERLLTPPQLLESEEWISWDACCELTTAVVKLLGRDVLVRVGETSWQSGHLREQATLAPLLFSSAELLEAAFGPDGFCTTPFLLKSTIDHLQNHTFCITLDFENRHVCESIGLFFNGQLRALPTLFGEETAEVEWHVLGNKAEYRLRLQEDTTDPPGRTKETQLLAHRYELLLRENSRSLQNLIHVAASVVDHEQTESVAVLNAPLAYDMAQFAQTRQAWLTFDDAGVIRFVSDGLEQLLGYSSQVLVGTPVTELLPVSLASSNLKRLLKGGNLEPSFATSASPQSMSLYNETASIIHLDRRIIPVRINTGSIQTHGEWVHGCLIENMTREQTLTRQIDALETQLAGAQKLSLLGQMSTEIAHDFNNILIAINGYVELLQQSEREPDQTVQNINALREIHQAVNRGTAIARRLLEFSRQDSAADSVIDINALLDGLGDMVKRLLPDNIELELKQSTTSACTRGDRVQIEQVLLNLAVNARDAMPAGGLLRIEVCEAEAKLSILIEDTGTGMDAETQAHIFEPFFSTKHANKTSPVAGTAGPSRFEASSADSGTGLGLAVCDGIIRKHGGSIDVSSQLGIGTQFLITLPAVTSPAAPIEAF